MSEHDDLADDVERDVAEMEHHSERVGDHADDARDKLEGANKDAMIPEALGAQDPAWREEQPTDDTSADADESFEHGSQAGDDEDPQYSGGDSARGAATD